MTIDYFKINRDIAYMDIAGLPTQIEAKWLMQPAKPDYEMNMDALEAKIDEMIEEFAKTMADVKLPDDLLYGTDDNGDVP